MCLRRGMISHAASLGVPHPSARGNSAQHLAAECRSRRNYRRIIVRVKKQEEMKHVTSTPPSKKLPRTGKLPHNILVRALCASSLLSYPDRLTFMLSCAVSFFDLCTGIALQGKSLIARGGIVKASPEDRYQCGL